MNRPRLLLGAALSALVVLLPGLATAAPESPARRSPVLEQIDRLLRHDGVVATRPGTSSTANRPVAVVEAPDPFHTATSKGFAASVPHAAIALSTLTRPASSPAGKVTPPRLDGLIFPPRPIDLASAGDVDGNGTTDWVHGEPYFTSGAQNNIGHVFIDRRAPGGAVTTLEIVGPAAFAGFGGSVSSAGDVNGDGFDDVIVGAPTFGSQTGRAFVYRGTALGLSPTLPWVLDGSNFEHHFGYSVAGAGDVNGDGFDDVIVGAPGVSTFPDIIDGRVYCYLGGAGGLSLVPAWTVDGAGNGARMGWSVAGNGDINADGYADVAVTSPLYSNGQAGEGRVQIFLGGPGGLSTTAAFNYETNNANWGADAQVAFPGDVNGDGYGELLVGLPGADVAGADDGVVSIFAGSPFVFAMTEIWSEFGGLGGMNFGFDVAPAGDLNGDGFADFLASAPGFPGGLWMENFGSSTFGPLDTYLAVQGTSDKRWGLAMAGAGDHGDGKTSYLIGSELLIVSPDPDPEAAQGFASYVVDQYPGRTLNEFPDPILNVEAFAQGSFLETELGTSMALADVNGDGFSDVIAGGPNYADLGSQQGHVLAWYGGPDGLANIPPPFVTTPKLPTLDGGGFKIPDWSFDGPAAGGNFGFSVANAGDVNGDGYDDVLVGALTHSGGAEALDGAAYLFLGGADGLALSPEWVNEGNEQSSFYGYAVGTAGDVNQDGYDDILVGAPLASPGAGLSAGKVYLYYGSASGPAHVAARVFNGSMAGAHLGAAVTGIGDVDGDGYPEIAISEVDYTNGSTSEGRVLVYRGGPGGVETLPILDWESNEALAYAGLPVAPAGDVNGDGHADLLVGAYNYSDVAAGGGAVFLFLGSTLGLGSAPAQTLAPGAIGGQFGQSVWTAGDLNKDGFGDVIVGSPTFLPPPPAPGGEIEGPVEAEGRCLVIFGTSTGLETDSRYIYGAGQLGYSGQIGRAVAGGGDVNGDGWPDLLFSAALANSGKVLDNGVLFVGLDNVLAGGLSRPALLLRSDNTTPIAHGLRSDLTTSFRVQGQARSLAGRGKVRLQWQVKSPVQPFDATGIGSSSLLRTGSASGGEGSSILLGGTVSGLTTGERYRVRTRIASRHPYFQRSRWFTSHRDGLLEMDLRTAGPTGFVEVEDPATPRALAFAGAAPNPLAAGDGTLLRFALPAAGHVTIEAWDVSGRRVARIFDGTREAGPSAVRWDGRDDAGRALPPGLYFLRLVSGGEQGEAKVVIAN